MLLILSGSVVITRKNPKTGQSMAIATRKAGEFLGEMALVEESPRFATVTAESPCEVLEFSKLNFEKIIREKPSFATQVLKSLSTKLRESDSLRTTELEERNRKLSALSRKLLEMNTFLDNVIDQSPTAMFLVTRGGEVLRSNQAAARLFGILNRQDDLRVEDLFMNLNIAERCQKSGGSITLETTGRRGGDEFPVSLIITTLSGTSDEILHLAICQDLSDTQGFRAAAQDYEKFAATQEAEQLLAEAVAEFQLKWEDRPEVFRNNALGVADSGHQPPDNVRQDFRKRFDNIRSLGQNPGEFTFVDLRVTVRSIMKFFKFQPRFRDIEFRLEVTPDFPRRLHLREVPIQHVITALLADAAEAALSLPGKKGKGVEIQLARAEKGDYALMKVIDSGPGIIDETFPGLFPEGFSDSGAGCNWGLFPVRRILQDHNGGMTAETIPGQGRVVTVRLPLRPVHKDG